MKQPKRERKSKLPRERESDTKKISLDLYQSGIRIEEIAAQRSLSVSTIETHLSYYISSGKLNIADFVSAEKQELIEVALAKYGKGSLRLLKENLPDQIGYGDIRFTIAATEINAS